MRTTIDRISVFNNKSPKEETVIKYANMHVFMNCDFKKNINDYAEKCQTVL